ncbi:BspA family leucine-rich repeat surface protein [Intestinibacter sp.]|uniref:BspA family leucine-rich repeat surface protein n=1 Tax=Intestinibacter sp. TaxID=1965304 RepID=UPI002A7669DB|nr:BspA family leucine-rich repeat surface protein [Intestinibacter sp.]MDY2737047.1 BspA family leucine-rich repeat surface protein [Intestinibacter sp.]
MFRLKLIKKPILFKLKCDFSFPPIVLANLQEKEVTPTKEKQEVVADKNYDGLSKVIVDKIPDEYIIPTGNIEIIENGIYNVREKETANVNIPMLKLGTKNITENGVYKASDDELDGYSEVTVETSGVDINDYYFMQLSTTNPKIIQYIKQIPLLDTSNVTNMYATFANLSNITTMPLVDTSKVTNMPYMFSSCSKLTTIPQLDTSNVTNMSNMFSSCSSLTSIPLLNTSNVSGVYNMFGYCNNITELGGLENLGQGYSTTSAANSSSYMLNLSSLTKLTEQSIINVLNNLYDIKTKGCKPQQVILGSTNLAKLTSEEGQQALSNSQAKGWSIS